MHQEMSDKLSDYLDDELTPPERQAVEAHLQECSECAATLADLRRIAGTAAGLGDTPPAGDLWPAIAARIASGPRAAAPPPRRRFTFTVPQFAAAAVLLAALSGWLAVRVLSPVAERGPAVTAGGAPAHDGGGALGTPVAFDEQQYDTAIRELQQAIDRGRGRLDPETVAAVERNLRLIDEAVDDARRALAADPSSGFLSGYMVQTRQRKLELLRQVAALTQADAR
jgi:putative zinc finger protein